MALGTVSIVHEADAVGPVKIRLVSFAGDGTYATPGSFGLADLFNTCCGAKERIVCAIGSGLNGDVGLEYTTQGEPHEVTCVASSDLFSCVGTDLHGLSSTDPVEFEVDPGDANALPGGIVAGTVYYVIAGGLTTSAFKVSATSGGSAVNITSNGKGRFRVVKADRLLTRTINSGSELTTADQSATTYKMLVFSK